MRRPPPALDAHAHVEPTIAPRELVALEAVVFAVTRSPQEWTAASERQDPTAVWGIGCHPKIVAAQEDFDVDRFAETVSRFALVGEVGLDGRSPVPMDQQRSTFSTILDVIADRPRVVTIHSNGASAQVLELLQRHPIRGAVLHWWRGTRAQTEVALELGCFFSFNGAEARAPKTLSSVPRDRVLTETDFPHTQRSDPRASRPGAVDTIEATLASQWSTTADEVRRQVWRNLRALIDTTDAADLLPADLQVALLSGRATG